MSICSNKLKSFFFRNSYYVTLMGLLILIFVPTFIFKLHYIFFLLYKINYNSINNALTTIFGILFAFVFTILTILFSLKEDSTFLKLIQANNRNKNDIIHYFCISIFSLFIVLIISLFLTITYVPNYVMVEIENFSIISDINIFLIYSLVYLIEFSIINIVLLMTTFIIVIKN